MRQSNLNDISARVARGTLFITAVSMLSLHAMAQSSDLQKPLPSPIFAAAAPVATAATQPTLANEPQAATAATTPVSQPASTAGNRMSGFAVPSDTADTLTKPTAAVAAAKPAAQAAIAQAPASPGATSRAGIPRLNKAKVPSRTPQHPLAEAYPGYDVVVCIAGCGAEAKAVSVYKPKQQNEVAPMHGGMQGGFIRVAMTTETNATECVAGCYDDKPIRSYGTSPATAAAAVTSPGSPIGATDRSVMVQTSTGMSAGGVPKKVKPKTPKKVGSEWFTRRFERKQTNTN
jgi:hypothetical protein